MSDIYDSLKALSKNEEAKKLFKEAKEPAGIEEAAGLYADIAAKTGFSISKDAIMEFLKENEASRQAQSAKAEGAVKEALDEEALEAVAGGGDYVKQNPGCDTTYDPGEWCWFSDSCSLVISYYSDTPGKSDSSETPETPYAPRNSLEAAYGVDGNSDEDFEDSFY